MFTIVNSVLLRPLPFGDADRVLSVWTRYEPSSGYNFPEFSLSGPEFIDYRARTRALEEVAAFTQPGATLTTDDAAAEPIRVSQVLGTANLFATLGAQPALGRAFREGDDQPGAPCVVVLSHGLWLDAFGGEPERPWPHCAPQRHAVRDRRRHAGRIHVPGCGDAVVAQRDRRSRERPVERAPESRLAGGRAARARRHVRRGGSRVADVDGQLERGVRPLRRPASSSCAPTWTRSSATFGPRSRCCSAPRGSCCSSSVPILASLLLARGEGRRRELAVRFALGAGRGRLVAQLLTESAMLALAGGALGVAAAMAFLDGLLSLYPFTLPRAEAIALDWRALAFAGSGDRAHRVAVRARACAARERLVARGRPARADAQASAAAESHLMRAFVVAEVALSVMLVACAGLLLRSYENVRSVDLRAQRRRRLHGGAGAARVDVSGLAGRVQLLTRRSSRDSPALPGVESAGAISNLPLRGGTGGMNDFTIEGRPQPRPGDPTWNAGHVTVTPGYFETMRVPLIEGRFIDASDAPDGPRVAVINEEAARRYWPGESPIGRRVRHGPDEPGAFPLDHDRRRRR